MHAPHAALYHTSRHALCLQGLIANGHHLPAIAAPQLQRIAALGPGSWQSTAEWGVTRMLTRFRCCVVRTSSFDLDSIAGDDDPQAAGNPASQQQHPPPAALPPPHQQQPAPAEASDHSCDGPLLLDRLDSAPAAASGLKSQRSLGGAAGRRKVSFTMPEWRAASPGGSPAHQSLLSCAPDSHEPDSDGSDQMEDIYTTAEVRCAFAATAFSHRQAANLSGKPSFDIPTGCEGVLSAVCNLSVCRCPAGMIAYCVSQNSYRPCMQKPKP